MLNVTYCGCSAVLFTVLFFVCIFQVIHSLIYTLIINTADHISHLVDFVSVVDCVENMNIEHNVLAIIGNYL